MAEGSSTQKNDTQGMPSNDGRLISENSGQFGVSDKRRAQLSQMEQDAGVQHEAADESVTSRPTKTPEDAVGGTEDRSQPKHGQNL